MAAFRLFYGVNREQPQGIDGELIEGNVRSGWSHDLRLILS